MNNDITMQLRGHNIETEARRGIIKTSRWGSTFAVSRPPRGEASASRHTSLVRTQSSSMQRVVDGRARKWYGDLVKSVMQVNTVTSLDCSTAVILTVRVPGTPIIYTTLARDCTSRGLLYREERIYKQRRSIRVRCWISMFTGPRWLPGMSKSQW